MSTLKKYVPNFLLPTDHPRQPGRIFDVPLRGQLFHKARPEAGNEAGVEESERRRSSVASTANNDSRRESWHPGMAFEGVKAKLHF
ncbi:hypothetical protein Z517_10422 [Fonsecaea pedrosoi CBS 271.37]|uniref:Uncharacterized protein n=1 Tax=Fonsecaea pedrosoi CBS 271.37 TaxID=1442368 RepID=A0A0D2GA25_9EURO|nr:uncharacterized protein Z517_10422 [Fonsecaea pedrosoi CBS 271.37]KIW75680.1 hypothetical protein Z517_10422 [Fonsecaea pedrosoi CBS 271.37]